jgi:hypothetical protein
VSAKINMFTKESTFNYLFQEKYTYWTYQTFRTLQKLACIKHEQKLSTYERSTYLSNIQVHDSTFTNSLLISLSLIQASPFEWIQIFMIQTSCSAN